MPVCKSKTEKQSCRLCVVSSVHHTWTTFSFAITDEKTMNAQVRNLIEHRQREQGAYDDLQMALRAESAAAAGDGPLQQAVQVCLDGCLDELQMAIVAAHTLSLVIQSRQKSVAGDDAELERLLDEPKLKKQKAGSTTWVDRSKELPSRTLVAALVDEHR
jgi:hypothetical protein